MEWRGRGLVHYILDVAGMTGLHDACPGYCRSRCSSVYADAVQDEGSKKLKPDEKPMNRHPLARAHDEKSTYDHTDNRPWEAWPSNRPETMGVNYGE